MLPTREEAIELVRDGLLCNPGHWGKHCFTAAHCAGEIAGACGDLDAEKAYILGLLHDIGRKFGVRNLGHVSDGYTYMKSLGYDEAARVYLVCEKETFVPGEILNGDENVCRIREA